jgi:protein gp37
MGGWQVSDGTAIEWTDASWPITAGCDPASAGCDNCYAAKLTSGRLAHLPAYTGLAVGGKFTGQIRLLPDRLEWPLHWRNPRKIFVCSMSDLFHPQVPDDYIAQAWAVMALAPQHTFQVLTKRHARMRTLLASALFAEMVAGHMAARLKVQRVAPLRGPLPNVWCGVSVENQNWANLRIPHLLRTPAAVRWLSCEPLLGPIDLAAASAGMIDRLGWVVAGGESGGNHRPLNLDWARSLRDQCVTAAVPYLFKQVGGRTPKAGGRLLDGRTWDQYPELVVGP